MSLYHFCLIELLFNYLLLAPLVQIANTQNSWADKGNQHQNQCSKKFAKVCILLPGWADYNGAFNYRKLALHLTVFTQPCKFHHRVRKRVNVTILCQIFFLGLWFTDSKAQTGSAHCPVSLNKHLQLVVPTLSKKHSPFWHGLARTQSESWHLVPEYPFLRLEISFLAKKKSKFWAFLGCISKKRGAGQKLDRGFHTG